VHPGLRAAIGVLLLGVLAAACGSGDEPSGAPSSPTTGVRTLTPLPPPPSEPPTGRLYADLRQSSRDAALGRMEVWLVNDTRHDVTPTRIRYSDPRFRRPVAGERLRPDPAGSERGYPLALPGRPACGQRHGAGRLSVTYAGRTVTLPVTDDNDIVARHSASRCLELAVARVADLRFADTVPTDPDGDGSTGTLTLVARPTGRPGHVLGIETVGGTPLLGSAGGEAWTPRVRVRSDGPARRIELPVQPARCDDHVFMESAGATAFLVSLRLDGERGQLLLRMDPEGASAAIAFARDACGL
jgi:hypothetical protein